jgi:hypothetical protein
MKGKLCLCWLTKATALSEYAKSRRSDPSSGHFPNAVSDPVDRNDDHQISKDSGSNLGER